MIIEVPKGYTFIKDENIIAFEEGGKLKLLRRHGKFDEIMYDITYRQKGRNKCYYCGRVNSETEPLIITLDHIYPRSLGGPTLPQNLIPACKRCNSLKENMTPEQFRAYERIKVREQKELFRREYFRTKYFQERWVHILPEEWISQTPISDLLISIDLQDTSTTKYKRIKEYYTRCQQFPHPIIVDCRGFVLDGFTIVLYAKNNRIREIPTIVLENVEVIF